MNKEKDFYKHKLTIGGFIALFILIIYVSFYQNNDKPFLESKWVSTKDPIYFHNFSKEQNGYIVKIFDKNGDFASKKINGVIERSTLTFPNVDHSQDIYTYKNGKVYVSNISKNAIKSEFTPLERIKHGPKK